MRDEVVLIGPVGAGKSTQGRLLSSVLGLAHHDLDALSWSYYADAGYTVEEFTRRASTEGFTTVHRWMCPARAYAVERILDDAPGGVLTFGAGHSHIEDPEQFERVASALAAFRNVILLLPSADLTRSVQVLRERSVRERDTDWIHDGYDFFDHWVRDPCNSRLARRTIYTDGRSPDDTRDEILAWVRRPPDP